MNLQNIICSSKLAETLKRFGVKQESFFYHLDSGQILTRREYDEELNMTSAFTVSELCFMLPNEIRVKDTEQLSLYKFRRNDGLWFVYYAYMLKDSTQNKYLMEDSITDYNEADACALLLIYLISNNIESLEKINNRIIKYWL